jgi:spore germination protein YaaH
MCCSDIWSLNVSDNAADRTMKTIAIISNHAFSLIIFRGQLIQLVLDEETGVYALAPDFS